ncbi:MAG TPA: galactokinase [Actinomycetota bacterium]|nr:galactokinase [Actinomycetota bacterium]
MSDPGVAEGHRRVSDVAAAFRERAGRSPDGIWRAPGRVNLIGEHTDYNDGYVLPFAIDRDTLVAAARRADDVVSCSSVGLGDAPDVTLDELSPDAPRGWWSYVHGVIAGLAASFGGTSGFDLLIASDVPVGAGLSSSAALECATALAVATLADAPAEPLELARIARYAEETYAGVPCGIMDQIASLFGERDRALFLDTRSLTLEPTPVLPAPHVSVVIDTGVKHALADGGYAERRRACEAAAAALGVAALRDVTFEDLDAAPALDPTLRARARHVVSENERVLAASEALRERDAERLGGLMLASHESLRADFEVSSDELDVAVASAIEGGAIGARMTGGGFGGSAIAIVTEEDAGILEAVVGERFRVEGMAEPRVLRVAATDGASRLA